MLDWKRTSERNLLYHLCHPGVDAAVKENAFLTLQNRLGRYFQGIAYRKNWEVLLRYQDDITAEVIARLVHYNAGLKGNSLHFRAYVRRTVLSVCAEFLRQSMQMATAQSKDGEFLDVIEHIPSDDPLSSPEDHLARQRQAQIMQQARERLSSRCQDLLHRDLDLQQPQKEIADALNMSHNGVRTSLSRCRQEWQRQIILVLAEEQDGARPEAVILAAISRLPPPYRRVVHGWLHNESLRRLGQEMNPPRTQAEMKDLLGAGLARLYLLLETHDGDEEGQ